MSARMTKIKNIKNSLCWIGCGVREQSSEDGSANLYRHFGNWHGDFPRILGINLTHDPTLPVCGIYPDDAQSYYKDTCTTMSITALFVIVRFWR